MKKRIIAVLLCVLTVCTLLPSNAFALPPYVIVFDCNGGTLGGKETVSQSFPSSQDRSQLITEDIPVLNGYIFKCWNTEKDGTGRDYSPGDYYYFSLSTTATFYAQWELPNWIDYADTAWYDSAPNTDFYTISTAEQLAGLAKLVNGGCGFTGKTVKLAGNISLAGKEWTPIGNNITKFCGIFDGAEYAVSGLFIEAPSADYQALFGFTAEATVKNVKVSGSVSGNDCVAGIIAFANGTVIENCVNDCVLSGKSYVGGIAGTNNKGLITGCCNLAKISADISESGSLCGGISGYNDGFVSNCYNIGDISGVHNVGGIAGKAYDVLVSGLQFTDPAILAKCVTNIYNCYNSGSVQGKSNVSGICGFLTGSASNCCNLGILEASEATVYGVAFISNSTAENVTDCYYLADCNASGNVFANKAGTALSSENFRKQESFSGFDFGGVWEMGAMAPVLKSFNNKGTDDNPYPIANLEMLEYMRDSVNRSERLFYECSVVLLRDIDLGCNSSNQWVPIGSGSAFCCNFDGKGHIITGLYINKPKENYVGFIGELRAGCSVRNLGVYGTVIGNNYVGGLVGFAYSQFENCFNACDVTGNSYVSGISGSGSYSAFLNCYNIGNITGNADYCGGITADPYVTDFYHCYNIGAVNCKGDFVGAIADNALDYVAFESCYYLSGCNADGTAFDIIDGVFALSETDFADKSKFVGWDFENTWDFSDAAVKRPLLKNAGEKGTTLNPFKVIYTDTEGGAAIHEFYYVTASSPTPKCKTDTSNMISWRFIKWDKSFAAKVTGDVTYTAKITMKASNTARYHANGTTCDIYWNSTTCTINPRKEFTRAGFELMGWNTKADGSGTTYKLGDTFQFVYPHNGDIYHFYAVWKDVEKPVFVGLESNKYYCKSVKFKVTDNGGKVQVKVGDTKLTADAEGYYTLNYQDDQTYYHVDYTVTATDLDGNVTSISVKLTHNHEMRSWGNDGEYIWRNCIYCGEPEDDKRYPLPKVQIVGPDTVCRSEDYKFTVTLPSDCSFQECVSSFGDFTPQLQLDGTYLCVIENNGDYSGLNEIGATVGIVYDIPYTGQYFFILEKEVTVTEHKGGTASCKEKAVCTECGKPYGETALTAHAELQHVAAKAATHEAEGNVEYWYCADCEKYFADENGTVEILKAETVVPKTEPEAPADTAADSPFDTSSEISFATSSEASNSGTQVPPETGDFSAVWVWLVLLLGSVAICLLHGAFTKKHSKNKT